MKTYQSNCPTKFIFLDSLLLGNVILKYLAKPLKALKISGKTFACIIAFE